MKKTFFKNENIEESLALLKEREDRDIWTTPYIKELEVKGVGSPVEFMCMEKFPGLIEDEDAIDETIASTGLFLSLPNLKGTGYMVAAVSDSATQSLYERCGFKEAKTINVLKSKDRRHALSALERAKLLSIGTELDEAPATILIRDNRVAYCGSSLYAPLLQSDLLSAFFNYLNRSYTTVNFRRSEVDFDMSVFVFDVEDLTLSKSVEKKLRVTNCELQFRLTTSDTGCSEVRVLPYFKFNDRLGSRRIVPLDGKNFRHIGNATVLGFEATLPTLCALGHVVEDLERMQDTKLTYSKSVFLGACKFLKLPKKIAFKEVADFEEYYDSDCSALEVFSWLASLAPEALSDQIVFFDRLLKLSEKEMSELDVPLVEWEE